MGGVETVERIKAYVLADPDVLNNKTQFIEGWGWDKPRWPEEHMPTAVRLLPAPCSTPLGMASPLPLLSSP